MESSQEGATMSMRSRSAKVVALASLAIAAASCTKPLDIEGLEGQLDAQVEREINTTITSVSCPDEDIEVMQGGTFTCTAQEESGATFTLVITQTDDQGNVSWDLVEAAP